MFQSAVPTQYGSVPSLSMVIILNILYSGIKYTEIIGCRFKCNITFSKNVDCTLTILTADKIIFPHGRLTAQKRVPRHQGIYILIALIFSTLEVSVWWKNELYCFNVFRAYRFCEALSYQLLCFFHCFFNSLQTRFFIHLVLVVELFFFVCAFTRLRIQELTFYRCFSNTKNPVFYYFQYIPLELSFLKMKRKLH